MNLVLLTGRIASDLVVSYMPSGSAVLNFSLATDESYVKSGEKVKASEFHNMVVFGDQAENIAKFLSKGQPITIKDGRLKTRRYAHKTYSDVTISRTEVHFDQWEFAISNPRKETQTENSSGIELPPGPSSQDASFSRGEPPTD